MGKADELSAAAKCNVLGERTCCGIYMEEKCHTVTGGEKIGKSTACVFPKQGNRDSCRFDKSEISNLRKEFTE